MGTFDKDRRQKELAVRYCLATCQIPFLEVVVKSATDLSDSVEVLTDLDVLGVQQVGDGDLRRTLFDCKTGSKLSAINRAFWAAGVKRYTNCDDAIVLLKNRPVHNHRMSALEMRVDLHDEQSFLDFAASFDPVFPTDDWYLSSIDRWELVADAYATNDWSRGLYDLSRNTVPLASVPWAVFRKIIADLKGFRGEFDPGKPKHVSIYLDVLSSCMVLWSVLGRDVRRFYQPAMIKAEFEKVLRYYLWGGRESYGIRQKIYDLGPGNGSENSVELPKWGMLVQFSGLVIASPQQLLSSAVIAKELSVRCLSGKIEAPESNLTSQFSANNRAKQFISGLNDYLIQAAQLPKDLGKTVEAMLFTK